MDATDIENRFTYHAPKEGWPQKYEALRNGVKDIAKMIDSYCQESREKSLAITHLEEAVFWANASIARHA